MGKDFAMPDLGDKTDLKQAADNDKQWYVDQAAAMAVAEGRSQGLEVEAVPQVALRAKGHGCLTALWQRAVKKYGYTSRVLYRERYRPEYTPDQYGSKILLDKFADRAQRWLSIKPVAGRQGLYDVFMHNSVNGKSAVLPVRRGVALPVAVGHIRHFESGFKECYYERNARRERVTKSGFKVEGQDEFAFYSWGVKPLTHYSRFVVMG